MILKTTRRIFRSSIFLALFLSACALNNKGAVNSNIPASNENVTVSGRVIFRDEPVSGADVVAYKSFEALKNAESFFTSATDSDGSFSLQIPPGAYFFIAKKENKYFSYSGRNPINFNIAGDYWLGFKAEKTAKIETSGYDDEYSCAVSGAVLYNDKPVKDAFVTIFLDASDDFKGPGYNIASSDSDGKFFFDYLPESEYFILVRKRGSGEKVGPIYEGDIYAYFDGNPLHTENGKIKNITINCVSKIDDQRARNAARPDTGISGVILDKNGAPLSGLYVFAYTDPVIGHKRPAALSLATGKDGRFVLALKDAGTYYIGAREKHGDSPEPGELFGMYDVTADHGVKVGADEFVEDIKIIVEKIMVQ